MSTSSQADDLFSVLADSRRRHVIEILSEHDALSLRALAEEIAGREAEKSDSDVSDASVERMMTSLHHCHVPKLADAGIVLYETRNGRVILADVPDLDWFQSELGVAV